MTRLEAFTDAAFAFAMTMLVISLNNIPGDFGELVEALKGVPAFAASFLQIMLFWSGHRRWSQRYGLEDGPATTLSLGLIFVMLVYVYPLRLMYATLFDWVSGGWLPADFEVRGASELVGLFMIYGFGTFALGGMIALLYRHAERRAADLSLDALERLRTREAVVSWGVQAAVGLFSALFAWLMPLWLGVWAGFAYCSMPIVMPWLARRYQERADELGAG